MQFIALVDNQKILEERFSVKYATNGFTKNVSSFHWMCGNRTMSVGNVMFVTNVDHDQICCY